MAEGPGLGGRQADPVLLLLVRRGSGHYVDEAGRAGGTADEERDGHAVRVIEPGSEVPAGRRAAGGGGRGRGRAAASGSEAVSRRLHKARGPRAAMIRGPGKPPPDPCRRSPEGGAGQTAWT